jgi:predicted DNA-binding antitoxin AbrB/MazE fold protein
MSKTVEAIYENGVFRPISSVAIKDHAIVRLIIEEAKGVAAASSGMISARSKEAVNRIALDPEFSPGEV